MTMWCSEHNAKIDPESKLCTAIENDPVMISQRDANIIMDVIFRRGIEDLREFEKASVHNLHKAISE